jgi:pantetheine-phosphate adenylyltransferase
LTCVKKIDADFILRGLRNPADFELKSNRSHAGICLQIETVFLLTAARTSYISSSIVRDVLATVVNNEKLAKQFE